MVACRNCGQQNPEGFSFCGACGSPLEPATGRPREERKIVTVLFCDIVGFTSRTEQLDPEDVRALLAPYHERLRSELERYGGTVEKFIGDAVMALFGAPVAHEDDPERALRAALSIRAWAAEQDDLDVRIGVNTGEALVSLDVHPEVGEGMAAGDVVNTAARLQAAASLNGILVGEQTFRSTRDVIDYEAAGSLELKGKEEPIPVWEATGARVAAVLDVAPIPLVGRRRELDLLRAALAGVREERSPQLVTLVGVPGIGKSRLLDEMLPSLERETEDVTWRQGRSLPYGEGVTFWALGEVAKAEAGILESDAEEEVAQKLERAVSGLVPEGEASWVEAHLRPLVGLGAGLELAGGSREEAFSAWGRFVESMAARRPTVVAVRGSPLGRRRSARLRRLPRRVDDRRSALRCLYGEARAAHTTPSLGRRQGELPHPGSRSALGRGHDQAGPRPAGAGRAPAGDPTGTRRKSRRQSTVRRGICPPRGRAGLGRGGCPAAARERAGHHRSTP